MILRVKGVRFYSLEVPNIIKQTKIAVVNTSLSTPFCRRQLANLDALS